jgi:hypothetical protein
MTTISFDTLELVDKLKTTGIPQEQAEVVVRVIADAQHRLVTKDDLETAFSPLKTDLAVLKWMIGILIAGVMSIVIKTFLS